MSKKILDVLSKLDPEDASQWTADGLPTLAHINASLGEGVTVTRAQITESAPEFTRTNPTLLVDEKAKGGSKRIANPNGTLENREDTAGEKEEGEGDSSANEGTAAAAKEEEQNALKDAKKEVKDAIAVLKDAQTKLRIAQEKVDSIMEEQAEDAPPFAEEVKRYQRSQAMQRAEAMRRKQRLDQFLSTEIA